MFSVILAGPLFPQQSRGGGTGRRAGFKIRFWQQSESSSLSPGTIQGFFTLPYDNGLASRTTVHGLRSTLRDWRAETGTPRRIADAALAHVVPGVEGTYFRSDLFEWRRRLMAQWADFAARRQGDVVRLRQTK